MLTRCSEGVRDKNWLLGALRSVVRVLVGRRPSGPGSGRAMDPGSSFPRVVALGAAASLVLGCGGVAGPQTAPASPEQLVSGLQGKAALQCEAGKEHWRSPGTPTRGGVFRKVGSVQHLDVTAAGGPNLTQIPQVYGHLVKSRGCYYGDSVMVPDLARAWEVSADGLTWTFRLREEVRWHQAPPVNGRAFTAADVAWTIEHQKQGGLLRSYWVDVGHETPDPATVVLRLKEPDADFLGKLVEKYNVMLPREVKEQYGDFKTRAIGTGAYVLKDYKPDQYTLLERNPAWKEMGVDGRPLPYIDQVEARNFADPAAEIAAFRAGLLDLNSNQSFRKDDADAIQQAMPRARRYEDWAPAVWGIWLHHEKKPWDDVRVRKAVALAVDPADLLAVYRGGAVRSGPLPAAILDFAWPPEKAQARFPHDPQEAQRLLAQAGYGPGQLSFTISTSAKEVAEAEVVQKHLEAIGMNGRIEVKPVSSTTTLRTGDYEVHWGAVSPASFYPDRWLGGAVRTGGSLNVMRLKDPELDSLSGAQGREMDPEKRKQIVDRMQDRLFEVMAYVPTLVRIYYRFYSCRVQNMRPEGDTPNLDGLTHAWLDPSGC